MNNQNKTSYASFRFVFILSIFILTLFSVSFLNVFAKANPIKGYEKDKGKEIIVSEPLGWPIKVKTSSYMSGSLESLPEMAIIRLVPYKPWWRFFGKIPETTTFFVSGLPTDTDLNIYTKGYREHQVIKTDLFGFLFLSLPSNPGNQIIIKTKPSTYHIKIDGLLIPPGGDCSDIGIWNVSTKTCTLIAGSTITQTIAIDDSDITLNGNNAVISGVSGDGVYTDSSNVTVKNLTVSNSTRGIVFADSFFSFAPIGGFIENINTNNNSSQIIVDDISIVTISNAIVSGGNVGIRLTDMADFVSDTDNLKVLNSSIDTNDVGIYFGEIQGASIERSDIKNNPRGVTGDIDGTVTMIQNNFSGNTDDIVSVIGNLVLSNSTNRGNWWEKNVNCVQDTASPDYCTNNYDAGPATDSKPWACKDGWLSSVNCPVASSPPPPPPPTGGSGTWAEISSTTGTATLYLESSHTTPIKELPSGWVLEVLDETGGYWKVKDVADDLIGYVDEDRLRKADNDNEKALFANNANRLSPDNMSNRAQATYNAVQHYWNDAVNENNNQSVYGLTETMYNFIQDSLFPKELFLAMFSHESGDFNNELVTFDYGHGIGQLTISGYTKDISYLQILLKKLEHYTGSITGVFKDDTKTAVIAFQKDQGLTADGVVGPITQNKLNQKLTEKRTEIPATDIPTGFTFRMNMQVNFSQDRDEKKSRYDNRSVALGIKIYPCLEFQEPNSQTASNGYKNCYANFRMKANNITSTPKATYYQNTPQSIYTNVREGLEIITGKYLTYDNLVEESPLPDIWITEGDTSINNTDMKILLGVRGYNGFGTREGKYTTTDPNKPLIPVTKVCKYYFDPSSPPTAKWYLDAVAAKTLILGLDYAGSVSSWMVSTPMYKKLLLASKNRRELCIGSPAYLQILDDQGNITGYSGNQVVDEIANVVYDNVDYEAASILIPKGNYLYRVIGTVDDTYKFAAIDIKNGTENVFRALDTPINLSAVHEYNIDWENLTSTTGVTIRIDQDGDGIFERTVTSGTTLTAEQFNKITICHIPPGNPANAHTISIGFSAWKAHQKHGDYEGECELSTNTIQSPTTNNIPSGQSKNNNSINNVQETSKGKKK